MQYFGILNVIYVEGFILSPSSCAHPSRTIESRMGQPDGEAEKNGQPSMYLFDGGYASFDTTARSMVGITSSKTTWEITEW